jgi:hypothetical protein
MSEKVDHTMNNMIYERARWRRLYYEEYCNQMYKFFITALHCKVICVIFQCEEIWWYTIQGS